MARLTTHVLDTARGKPAVGLVVELYALLPERRLIGTATTNDDGRADRPFGADGNVPPGTYELLFRAGDYFRRIGAPLSDPPFIDLVPLRFGIAEGSGHYHVPLL